MDYELKLIKIIINKMSHSKVLKHDQMAFFSSIVTHICFVKSDVYITCKYLESSFPSICLDRSETNCSVIAKTLFFPVLLKIEVTLASFQFIYIFHYFADGKFSVIRALIRISAMKEYLD